MSGAGSGLVGLAEIRDAARGLERVAVRTPLIPVARLEPPLLVKPESLQPTGSFKLRGAYTAISGQRAGRPAARSRGPFQREPRARGGLRRRPAGRAGGRGGPGQRAAGQDATPIEYYGAELVRVEPTLAARVAATEELVGRGTGTSLIPPFDDRAVIAGQGTVGLEIAADCPQVGLVLVPVSGGGLISGIAAAVRALLPGRGRGGRRARPRRGRPRVPAPRRAGQLARGRRPAPRWPTRSGSSRSARCRSRTCRALVAGHRHGDRGRDARRGPAARDAGPAGGRTRRRGRGRGVAVPPGRAARRRRSAVAVLSGGNIDPALLAAHARPAD